MLLSWKILVYGELVYNVKWWQSRKKQREWKTCLRHESLCESKSMPFWGLMKRPYIKVRGPLAASCIITPTKIHDLVGLRLHLLLYMERKMAHILRVPSSALGPSGLLDSLFQIPFSKLLCYSINIIAKICLGFHWYQQ